MPIFYWREAIGEWNMDSTASKDISFRTDNGMDDILSIEAWVRNDSESVSRPLGKDEYGFWGSAAGGSISYGNQQISISRMANGEYDTIDYNATASTIANRGWVNVIYTVGQTRPT